MAEYHVRTNSEGQIFAGTQTKTGKWQNSSDVTQEALAAVRDHLLIMTQKEDKAIAFAWQYPNGKTLLLKLEEDDSKEIKEGE